LTFDGILIDDMSFQMLASEDPCSMVLTMKSAAKRTGLLKKSDLCWHLLARFWFIAFDDHACAMVRARRDQHATSQQ
jgi:hypothetical protein